MSADATAIAQRLQREGLDFLRPRLLPTPGSLPLKPTRGDFDLNPELRQPDDEPLAPAAVLVPLIWRDEPTLLFTKRTEHLSRHAGQVSFPGGRVHDDDTSLVETALRETQEETGIGPEHVTIAGFLDVYETRTGFVIQPVVGILSDSFSLVPDAGEVEEAFEVPLSFLLNPESMTRGQIMFREKMRNYLEFRYGGQRIWGATAAMLVGFLERLRQP